MDSANHYYEGDCRVTKSGFCGGSYLSPRHWPHPLMAPAPLFEGTITVFLTFQIVRFNLPSLGSTI